MRRLAPFCVVARPVFNLIFLPSWWRDCDVAGRDLFPSCEHLFNADTQKRKKDSDTYSSRFVIQFSFFFLYICVPITSTSLFDAIGWPMIRECVILSEYRRTIAKLRLHRMNYVKRNSSRRAERVSFYRFHLNLTLVYGLSRLPSGPDLYHLAQLCVYIHTRRMYICIHVVYINGKIIENGEREKSQTVANADPLTFSHKSNSISFFVCYTRFSFSYTLCCLLSKRCVCVYIMGRDAASFLSLCWFLSSCRESGAWNSEGSLV